MYRYDATDKQLVHERVEQFRDQTRRFLAGDIAEEEFRDLRLRNGLYVQRFAPMLRVSIPYGLLNSAQLHMLGDIASKYDKGYGHFTTRQNIQYNWPKLETVPDILADLATVEMHAIQTSGNCVRNITADQFAGVAKDELVDPRPYCEITRQWSTFHPEFNWLPRNFKFAFSATETDRAATAVHDIGVHIVKNDAGEIGYRIFVGGGLGRMPMIGHCINEFLPEVDLLSYCEAILRVYNRLGRRDNKHRARIKVLVKATGVAEFTKLVEAEWVHTKETALKLLPEDLVRMRAHFPQHAYSTVGETGAIEKAISENPEFAKFVKRNVKAHKQDGYRIVHVSLKAPGEPPGDISAEQMHLVANLAKQYSFDEIRSTHEQNLVLADVHEKDVFAVWQALQEHNLATPNIGLLTDMICCPGLDFCSLANAGSIGVSQDINDIFDQLDYLYDIGEIKLKMSGCMNGCGHHTVGHIGILGVDKKGEEWYQITLGGSAENDACLGDRTGPAVDRKSIAPAIETIVKTYIDQRIGDEEPFLATYKRVGMDPFKEALYP